MSTESIKQRLGNFAKFAGPLLLILFILSARLNGPIVWVLGIILGAIVFATSLYIYRRIQYAQKDTPALRLDSSGLHDNIHGFFLPWGEVQDIRLYQSEHENHGLTSPPLVLTVKNPRSYWDYFSVYEKILQWGHMKTRAGNLSIDLNDLDVDPERIEEEAKRLRQRIAANSA